MNENPKKPLLQFLRRDGSSQAARRLAELDPGYAPVDERSIEDLLAFAREYAKELSFIGVENGKMKELGDWSAFLSDEMDIAEAAAYLQNPEKFSPEQARPWARPHFALFLTFLHLLRQAQDQLNTMTKRHLDFYYQKALGMTKKSGEADRVNVLVDLAPDVTQHELPAGTRLNAGADSAGADLLYETDQTLVINQAQVARLSSLFAEKRVTGIREAREEYDGPAGEAFVEMLKIALGGPLPGGDLPLYRKGDEEEIDFDRLLMLHESLAFIENENGLSMKFDNFRDLMRLKKRRDDSGEEWKTINALLEKAAKKRDPNIQWVIANAKDFDANFELAIKDPEHPEAFDKLFDGITEVKTIYDVYAQRIRESVKTFIRDELFFDDADDFNRMMQLKIRIDNEWEEINRILAEAGAQKGTLGDNFPPKRLHEDNAFEENLQAALGDLSWPEGENIDAYHAAFLHLEDYFYLPAENFHFIMSVAKKEKASLEEWEQVYQFVAEAHEQSIYAKNRERLADIRENDGFEAMTASAAGDDPSLSDLTSLQRLLEYVRSERERKFLRGVAEKIEQIAKGAAEVEISEMEWRETYSIVEIARRIREDKGAPVARKEEWRNLYALEDARTAVVQPDLENDAQHARWKTFGQGQSGVSHDSPPPKEFGWAICSPLLALSQGVRAVNLTLGFESEAFDAERIGALWQSDDPPPLRIAVSTEKGWIEIDASEVEIGDYYELSGVAGEGKTAFQALRFELTFAENIDALAPPPEDQAWIKTSDPALKIMLRHIWRSDNNLSGTGQFITEYSPFKNLSLQRVHLQVSAAGLVPALAQNDEAVLDASKPFEPFGVSPVAGARLLLGHPEIAAKKLDSLSLHFEWMGAPDNLLTHYANYDAIGDDSRFTSTISLIDHRLAIPLSDVDNDVEPPVKVQKRPLFVVMKPNGQNGTPKPGDAHEIAIDDFPAAVEAGRPGFPYSREAAPDSDEDDLLRWNRYLQLELNAPDFQHQAYPSVATEKSVALAAEIANKETVDATKFQVNPPYTPKLKKLTLDYTSATEIILKDNQRGAKLDRMYHLHPFGYCEMRSEEKTGGFAFLPQFDFEGELFIGVSNARPPQNLSLLFQMAEGSADPDIEPEPVQWSRLDGDRWISMEDGGVLADATRGLINSGIIQLELKPAAPSVLLPGGFYWLRAAIPGSSKSVCDTVAIHAQAVSATFVDQDNAPDHLSKPLAAESITDLAEAQPEIAGVRQPYTSYGGKPAEQDRIFYTRISERLRHKHRALSFWDYEHMVLEQFPRIYKAKCLPANPERPGRVEIVVIPDIRGKLPFNPFEPKAPTDVLVDIEDFLTNNVPAFVSVTAKNAHYVPVKVRFGVRFLPGYNEGFYKGRLNEELNRFLSPWAYEEGADIVIGGRIYANVIINFIEERPYVDYVTQIKLFSSEDGRNFDLIAPQASGGYWVETSRADGVLVAARRHEIDVISETGYEEESFTGVNYMKVELDFVVGENVETLEPRL